MQSPRPPPSLRLFTLLGATPKPRSGRVNTRMETQKAGMRACIVYLTQLQHSSYTRSASQIGTLQNSLALLHRHYNTRFRHDVLLFHTGDFDGADTQRRVFDGISEVASLNTTRFVRVPDEHWRLPAHLLKDNRSEWYEYPRYSLGYRHMIRWFVIGLWDTVDAMGYTHVMRLDDDSQLLSPIGYDIFSHVAAHGIDYAFRLTSYESGFDGERFHTFVRRFLLNRACQSSTTSCAGCCPHRPAPGAPCPECHPAWLLDSCAHNATIGDYSYRRCGELYGAYNNWFVTSLAFWRSAGVQRFLRHVDRAGVLYRRRYGDLQIQSVAVQIYLPKSRVHMFTDFTYAHSTTTSRAAYLAQQPASSVPRTPESIAAATGASNASSLPRDCTVFGGVSAGTADPNGYATVVNHIRGGAFCRMPCLRVYLHKRRLVLSATAGQVKLEQPDCARTPPPYYCHAASSLVTSMLEGVVGMAGSSGRVGKRATRALGPGASFDWRERVALDADRQKPSAVDRVLRRQHAGDATKGNARGVFNSSHMMLFAGRTQQTALWARAASSAAPLGTCALPPTGLALACLEAIRLIRAHPNRHNLASGVRYGCPSSIHRYLASCRPESRCVRAEYPWYLGREELVCDQRAVHRRTAESHAVNATPLVPPPSGGAPASTEVSAAARERRHHWLRHQCERLSSLPSTDIVETPKRTTRLRAKAPQLRGVNPASSEALERIVRRQGVQAHKKAASKAKTSAQAARHAARPVDLAMGEVVG